MNRPAPHGVDVWIASFDQEHSLAPDALRDPVDAGRYARIVPPARKWHFLFRRAVRRYVLEQYAQSYEVVAAPDRKPVLAMASGTTTLHFNSTASRHVCAIGVSDQPLGIDVEVLPPRVDLAQICGRFVPSPESSEWAHVSKDLERHLATSLWCRLEAYVKLLGTQLHTVLFTDGPMQTWLAGADHHAAFILGSRYVCCVAQRGDVSVKQVFHLDGAQLVRGEAPAPVFDTRQTSSPEP